MIHIQLDIQDMKSWWQETWSTGDTWVCLGRQKQRKEERKPCTERRELYPLKRTWWRHCNKICSLPFFPHPHLYSFVSCRWFISNASPHRAVWSELKKQKCRVGVTPNAVCVSLHQHWNQLLTELYLKVWKEKQQGAEWRKKGGWALPWTLSDYKRNF